MNCEVDIDNNGGAEVIGMIIAENIADTDEFKI